jgi:hypothetical protein
MTDGEVPSATQRDRMLLYLRERRGVVTPDLTKATVEKLLKGKLDPVARELLEIRQQASATSPAKYTALIDAASSDGRLRGTIQFCGASRTGRDAGRIFQPQNLPRTPDWFDDVVQETTITALKTDCDDLLYENISERCAFAVRGALVAAPGKKFLIADYLAENLVKPSFQVVGGSVLLLLVTFQGYAFLHNVLVGHLNEKLNLVLSMGLAGGAGMAVYAVFLDKLGYPERDLLRGYANKVLRLFGLQLRA